MNSNRTKFNMPFKRKALLILKNNNFNYKMTSQILGDVAPPTLRKWRSRYGEEVYNSPGEKESVRHLQAELAYKDGADIREAASENAALIMRELRRRLSEDANKIPIKDLIALWKEIGPFILPKFDKDKDGGAGETVEERFNLFIQNTYNNQNGIENGSKKQDIITIKGSTEELPSGPE